MKFNLSSPVLSLWTEWGVCLICTQWVWIVLEDTGFSVFFLSESPVWSGNETLSLKSLWVSSDFNLLLSHKRHCSSEVETNNELWADDCINGEMNCLTYGKWQVHEAPCFTCHCYSHFTAPQRWEHRSHGVSLSPSMENSSWAIWLEMLNAAKSEAGQLSWKSSILGFIFCWQNIQSWMRSYEINPLSSQSGVQCWLTAKQPAEKCFCLRVWVVLS